MTARTSRKVGHGGARKGSGRKQILLDRKGITVQFDGATYDELTRIADEGGSSLGSLVRRAVAEFLARKKKR